MKKLSQKVQPKYDKLIQQKSKEEKEERELHEKHEHVNVLYTMICNLLQVKNSSNADDNIEKLQFELEQDKKYSWGTLFNGIFFINQCPTLNVVKNSSNVLELDKDTASLTLNPLEEVMQNSLVNSSYDLTEQISAEPLLEILASTEVLQASIHHNSSETLENHLQVSSDAPTLENVCEEPMSVSIQDSLQDPSQQSLEVLQNEMLLQPETMEVSL